MSDEVADVLADSREYLEKKGWWKGSILGPNGRQVCSIGALLYSQGYDSDGDVHKDPLLRQAVNRLAALANDRPLNHPDRVCYSGVVISWNDAKERTKQEVLDLFSRAEKIERNEGVDPDE